MAETIREFLVSIGYKVDGSSERRFEDSMKRATLRAELLGRAIAEAAEAMVRSATRIAGAFDDVYYASQRTGASVQNMKALGYAVSQLGGSYGGAMGAIENFSRNLRSNPGYASMVRMLGVSTEQNGRLKDTTQIIRDLSKELARSNKPYYIQKQYFEALGLDEQTYNALKSGDLVRYLDEYNKKQRELGVDQARAAEIGRDLTRSWRSLNVTLSALGEKLMQSIGPALTRFVNKLDEFITNNADKIEKFFENLLSAIEKLVLAFIELVEKGEGPLVDMFEKIGKSVDTLMIVLAGFATFLVSKWLLQILGAFTAVGSGFGAMLLKLGINPAVLGLGIAMAPTAGNAGEDAEIARRKAEGTWGPARAGELEADARSRAGGGSGAPRGGGSDSSRGGGSSRSAPAADGRNFWQRHAPTWLGGRDAPGTGNNVGARVQAAAANIPVHGKALLDTIASTEASGYDIMYGNRKFTDYKDHPRQYHTIVSGPNAGKKTSAAGRYQFLASTWDQQARRLGLKDFSPQSQDIAAWDLAKRSYRGDLEADLKSGDPKKIAAVGRALNQVWTSLPGGPEQGQGADRMNRTFSRSLERQQATEEARKASTPTESSPAATAGPAVAAPASPGAPQGEAPGAAAPGAGPTAPGDVAQQQAASQSPDSQGIRFKNITKDTSFGTDAAASLTDPKWMSAQKLLGHESLGKTRDASTQTHGLGSLLSPDPMTAGGSSSTTISQKNEITVNGASDPSATASAVENGQKPLNASLIRNVQGAVR